MPVARAPLAALLVGCLCGALAAQSPLGLVREAPGPRRPPALWTVDAGGGGDFLDLQSAIDAALDGDAIRVRPGTYEGFVWEDKGLVIYAEPGPRPLVDQAAFPFPQAVIRNVPAHATAVLRNLEFRRPLSASDVSGALWVEDCAFFLPHGTPITAIPIVRIERCANAVVARCAINEGAPFSCCQGGLGTEPEVGLLVQGSWAALYDSFLQGPHGITNALEPHFTNQQGGTGVRVVDSTVFASDSTFSGGRAGQLTFDYDGCTCGTTSPGGIGLEVLGDSSVETLDCAFTGGSGNPVVLFACFGGAFVWCGPSLNGAPSTGPITTLPGVGRAFVIEAPALAGGTFFAKAYGRRHDLVLGLYSPLPEHTPVPLHSGIQHTGSPITIVPHGTIPPSGFLKRELPVPPLSLFTPFDLTYAQGLFFEPGGSAFLSSPSVLLLTAF